MISLRAMRVARCCAIAAGVTTYGAILLSVSFAAPQRWPLVVSLVGALLCGLGGAAAVALIPADRAADLGGHTFERLSDTPTGDLRIGTLMSLGGVPDEVARMTSAIAATTGPVLLLVPPGRMVPVGLDPAVVAVESSRAELHDTLDGFYRRCDAVLIASARALPTAGCADIARLFSQGVDWVQGSTEPLNRDRFGPMGRESLDARLRRHATAVGLWCWQPDATIVRSSLLLTHPLQGGRPFGSWLRERVAEGAVGTVVDSVLTRSVAPVAAQSYWPDTTARQCASAADLADAALSGHCSTRAKAVAVGLLVRTLSGWSVLWWLAALVLLADGSPVRRGSGALVALMISSVVLRWLAPRLATGVEPSPLADATAGLYSLPGSLIAARAAVTRRIRPSRWGVPARPLAWLALVGTAAAASVVLTATPGESAARVAAGIAAALLVLTWIYTVRSLIERSWRRVGFRVPLQLRATVQPTTGSGSAPEWRLVDGGPGGFALVGPATGHRLGDEVTVRVPHSTSGTLILHGTVAARRDDGDHEELIGVALGTVEPGPATWAQLLVDAAGHVPAATFAATVDSHIEGNEPSRRTQRIDRLAVGLVLAVSAAVVLVLGLVFVGLQPLVIRSGSMKPTYNVGDVVLVSPEQAGDIREGQVVTRFDAPEATDSLTHRVRHVTRTGDSVEVETRGDANESSEIWTAPVTQLVGVVVASVPAIGLPLTAVRSSLGWAILAASFLLVGIMVLLFPLRSVMGQIPFARRFLNPTVEAPIEYSTEYLSEYSTPTIGEPQ